MLTLVCRLPYTTNLPRDVSITTWTFGGLAPSPTDIQNCIDRLIKWWNIGVGPGNYRVSGWIAPIVQRASCRIDVYEHAATTDELGEPIASRVFTMGALSGGSESLPLEVALCNSIQASAEDPAPLRNRRGRQYIGPFATQATGGGTSFPVPNANLITTLVLASDRLADESATGGTPWVVWSRKLGKIFAVDSGWVNNAWDTQRRRGNDPTQRTAWTNIV